MLEVQLTFHYLVKVIAMFFWLKLIQTAIQYHVYCGILMPFMYFKEIEDFNQGLRNIQIFLFYKNDMLFSLVH